VAKQPERHGHGAVELHETDELDGPAPSEPGDLPPLGRERTPPSTRRFKPVRFTIKLVLFVVAMYFFVLPLAPDFQAALRRLRNVEPGWLAAGAALDDGGRATPVPPPDDDQKGGAS